MKLREWLSRLDRGQKSLPFKIIASIVLIAAAIAAFSTYYVVVTLPGQQEAREAIEAISRVEAESRAAAAAAAGVEQPEVSPQEKSAIDAGDRVYRDLMAARASPVNVAVGAAVLTGLALGVVWLGLGLTYLALMLIAVGVVLPLYLAGFGGMARVLLGLVALTAAFAGLMQVLRVLMSGPGPVFAVARNVLTEAVRMKISLVFIVILIFAMAVLPGSLEQSTPLRYRVQSFLQYSMGISFWIIAALVLFFSVATVSFEQRDKQIWQTMTKPVWPWQYILGKWLGVSGLAAVLLAVSCAGVFLFTEYLRQQPAHGERQQVVAGGADGLTEDRMILETQVLAARRGVQPDAPMAADSPEFLRAAEAYIQEQRARDRDFAPDAAAVQKVISDLHKGALMQLRSIGPAEYRIFGFSGLREAKRRNVPLTLRYRIESGGNAPDQLYKVTFNIGGVFLPPQEATLGPTHSIPLMPGVITDDGYFELAIYNGAMVPDQRGEPVMIPNPGTLSIPPDGLEVTYSAGSYQMNFLRVALILWIKLAFLAILGIAAATFLSFPVACLVAFAVFLIAEGTGFLSLSLEYYDAMQPGENKIVWWKVLVRAVGLVVAWMFKTYSELKPTMRLVDGRLLGWGSVAWGAFVLVCWSAALWAVGVLIFRRRELATYSGQ